MSTDYETPILSYANKNMPVHHRLAIRSLEQFSGRGKLYRRYRQYQRDSRHLPNTRARWDLAVERLGVCRHFTPKLCLPERRAGKGLLMVANHPYGIMDGVLLAWLASHMQEDFRVIAINILRAEPSLNDNILPIDFDPTREAMRININTRRAAIDHLKGGNVVAIFPAGGVSWARKRHMPVKDEDWKPMTGKLINTSGCDVLPICFQGENSGLYQFFSRHMMSIRPGLYLRELRKHLDRPVDISVGEIIPNEALPKLPDQALAQHLRQYVDTMRIERT